MLGDVEVASLRSHWLSLVSPSLVSFGDYPLMASVALLAVGLRPRLSPFSNSLAFFYRHIKHNWSIVLSFYFFFDLFILFLPPASAPRLLFSLRFDRFYTRLEELRTVL